LWNFIKIDGGVVMPEDALNCEETELLEFMDSLEVAQASLNDYGWQRGIAGKLREELRMGAARALRRAGKRRW
jgi:hypothetical protein